MVTEAGTVVINLDPDHPIESSTTSSSSTTTTLHVTGTTPGLTPPPAHATSSNW